MEIGLNAKQTAITALELSKLLADETILCTKTKNAHWNTEDHCFYETHKFFDSQIEQLNEIIDSIAERIRSIGHYPPAKLSDYLSLAHLSEPDISPNIKLGFIQNLLSDHESIIMHISSTITILTADFHDAGTVDFITGLLSTHEKMAWYLRAHFGNPQLNAAADLSKAKL